MSVDALWSVFMRSTSARIPISSDAIVAEILVPISSSFRMGTCWCSSFPWACRSSDPSNRRNLLSSDSQFFSKAAFTPNRIFSKSFLKNSSFTDVVDTVGTIGLLVAIGCHDIVGVASSTGGASSDSTSSLDIVRSSDSSSDSITSNLGGLWSTWRASELRTMFVVPSSFW